MGGNVSEWTDDCWHGNYVQAPVGPEAWINPGCSRRVVRGGSWNDTARFATTAARWRYPAYQPVYDVGFRVVIRWMDGKKVAAAD